MFGLYDECGRLRAGAVRQVTAPVSEGKFGSFQRGCHVVVIVDVYFIGLSIFKFY